MENIKFKACCQGCKNLSVTSRVGSDLNRNRYTIVECTHMPVCCKYMRANSGEEHVSSVRSGTPVSFVSDMGESILMTAFFNENPNA